MDKVCPKTDQRADIPGFSGFQASLNGEIFDPKGRLKRQRPAGNGAMQVHIGKSTRMVHDLVARAFHGCPTADGYRVKHLNGNPSDNREENLIWSGSPRAKTQKPTTAIEFEQEYDRVRQERLALIDLMQS